MKKILSLLLLFLILVLVSILIYANAFNNDDKNSDDINAEKKDTVLENRLATKHTSGSYVIENLTIVPDDSNNYVVTFDFTNNSQEDKDYLDIRIILLNQDEDYVFDLPIHIESLKAGETRSISYELQIDISSSFDYTFIEQFISENTGG